MSLTYKVKGKTLSKTTKAMNSEKIYALAEQIALKGNQETTDKANNLVRLFVSGKIEYNEALKELENLLTF